MVSIIDVVMEIDFGFMLLITLKSVYIAIEFVDEFGLCDLLSLKPLQLVNNEMLVLHFLFHHVTLE